MSHPEPRLWPWLLLAGLTLSWGLGSLPLLDPDEPRYASASLGMASSADWVVPVFNGEPRLNKPPLLYWAQAAAFRTPLREEIAARLPSLTAALLLAAAAAWWAGRRL
ncbi:MAG TPA: hypothetical protein VJV23_15320, partial [Candidatus Polarisedimenticolia bacterium]|nr:hypothetical protein [Candidatus Polarisedimenticolia bacterium]